MGVGIRRDFGVGSLPRKRALVFCLGVFLFCRVLRIGVLECWAHVLDGIEVVVAVAEFTFALLLGSEECQAWIGNFSLVSSS